MRERDPRRPRGPRATGRCRGAAVVLLSACLAAAPGLVAGASRDGAPGAPVLEIEAVRAPYFGDVLFHHYAGDDREALVRLLAGEQLGRLGDHGREASAVAGSLLLDQGLLERAEARFEAVLAAEPAPALRDHVHLQLARLRHRRDEPRAVLAALEGLGGEDGVQLAAAERREAAFLGAQAELALGRPEDAARRLGAVEAPGPWAPWLRYNLAVALVRSGRGDEGLAILDALGDLATTDRDLLALRDRANLAAGYARLRAGDPESARRALERVRLDGPETEAALLGLGWARAEAGDLAGALPAWGRLLRTGGGATAVHEARLAVPWVLAEQGADGAAARGYEDAVAALDGALAELEVARGRARDPAWLATLLDARDPVRDPAAALVPRLPADAEAARLRTLVASRAFQRDLAAWRDLGRLAEELDAAAGRIDAFADMVALQRRVDGDRAPRIETRRAGIDPAALRARRDALAARLERARAERDPVVLATAEEARQWSDLEAVGAMRALEAAPEAARDRYRILRGHLYWQLDREFDYRAWQQSRVLEALDGALADLGPGLARLDAARASRPADLDARAERLAQLRRRIALLAARADAARGARAVRLADRVDDWFDAERERLLAYRVQARFALATLYDRAASGSALAAAGDAP